MTSQRWPTAFLESQRKVTDSTADKVMEDLIEKHGIGHVNQIFRSLVDNDGIVPDEMPQEVKDYLAETAVLPEWADPELILRGEDFFDRHWPLVVTFLFCAALPNAYAAHRGAQVLFLTTRLTERVERRIFETAQFVLDVMSPGGLGPNGHGIRSAQKVRLMHAAIRQHILKEERWRKHWNLDDWGCPINQEDMAGTLMTFSVQILDGFRRFRIPISKEEQEAYLHSWRVIGYVMGVEPDLMPETVDDAFDMAHAILNHQKGPSDAGRALAAALVGFMEKKIPFRILRGLPVSLIRRSIDGDIADMLDIPKAGWTRVLVSIGDLFVRFLALIRPDGRHINLFLDRLSAHMIQGMIDLDRGGKRTTFKIPEKLRSFV